MTIYAIANNLIDNLAEAEASEPIWTVVSASAILQGGNPYFVPDFDSKFEAHPAIALRIGKLGKGIAPRFAYRYIESVAPAAVMTASNLLQNLQKSGLPWAKAISYDRSIAIGAFSNVDFEDIPTCKVRLELFQKGDSDPKTYQTGELLFSIGEIISSLSRDNALKTGDIILTSISPTGATLTPGQRAELSLDKEKALKFNIR